MLETQPMNGSSSWIRFRLRSVAVGIGWPSAVRESPTRSDWPGRRW